jgi:hypothetical protein
MKTLTSGAYATISLNTCILSRSVVVVVVAAAAAVVFLLLNYRYIQEKLSHIPSF